MEERKTFFDYMAQIFCTFGISVLLLIILGYFFGGEAQSVSTIFQLGKAGLTGSTMLQFLLVSVAVTAIRFLFFTDTIIRKMSNAARTIGMLLCVIVMIGGMVILFDWFPTNQWEPWVMFFISFGVCFLVSLTLTVLKEKLENRKMEEALEKIQSTEIQEKI